jgi:RNA polymerase sigma-70 factor (ECF subfamily)
MAIAVKGLSGAVPVWRANEADEVRWDELVAMVHRQMRSLVGPSRDLEDLTQGALEQVLRALDGFRGDGELSTFTYRICMNVLSNHRRWWRRWLVRFDLGDVPEAIDARSGPREVALERERARHLHACVERLAPPKRFALILSDLEELPASRVAEIMECPEPTVRSRLRQARIELGELLARDPAFADRPSEPGGARP